jgi:hypothetical protein
MVLTGIKKKHAKENLFQCYFVHHKSHSDRPRIEPRPTLSSRGLTALKTKIGLNYIEGFRLYRAVNTLRLGYKNRSFNSEQGNNNACSKNHTKHINAFP